MRLPTVTDNLGQLTTSDTACVASRHATAGSASQTFEIKVTTETVLRHSSSRFPIPFPHGLMPDPIQAFYECSRRSDDSSASGLLESFGKVDKFTVEDKARSSLLRTYVWVQVRSQLFFVGEENRHTV